MSRSLDDINLTDTDDANHTHRSTNSSHSLHQNSSLVNSTRTSNRTAPVSPDTGSDISGVNEDARIVGGQLQGQGGSPWQVSFLLYSDHSPNTIVLLNHTIGKLILLLLW